MANKKVLEIYNILFSDFGSQGWWPADTDFEVIIGAILTQNTNWKNVEKAIINLKNEKLLTVRKLSKISLSKLERLIKPSGFFRQKAKRIKDFLFFVEKKYKGSIEKLLSRDKEALRSELLLQKGIGPETADSIVLYAAHKPSFVIDAYTKRIFSRLGLIKTTDYSQVKSFFEMSLPNETQLFKEYHALIVELAKRYCRKKPLCIGCPVKKGCKYKFN